MTHDQRKQLEEMADEHGYFPGCDGINSAGEGPSIDPVKSSSFMAGAQAAFDLATKASEEKIKKLETVNHILTTDYRIKLLLIDFYALGTEDRDAVMVMVQRLCARNPAPRIDGTEERES